MHFHFIVLIFLSVFHQLHASDFFHSFTDGKSFNSMGSGEVRDEEFYRRLGVDASASMDEIKRAYRREAMRCHPDKGGDAEQFKKLSEAYEVLSDTEKRSMYDKFGKEGLAGQGAGGGMGGGHPGFGAFGDFFRGFGGFAMPVMMQLDLTLEDFYSGREVSIPLQGRVAVKVKIEPGMQSGQQLVARGHISDNRGTPRDLIFRLNEIRHPVFQRRNADLLMEVRLSLREALLGFERVVKHLDGKEFWIKSRKGQVTSPDDIWVLQDLGMPVYGGSGSGPARGRGRLFVRMRVDFPKKLWLEEPECEALERLLKHAPLSSSSSGRGSSKRRRRPEEPALHAGQVQADLAGFGQVGGGVEDEDEPSPFSQFFFR